MNLLTPHSQLNQVSHGPTVQTVVERIDLLANVKLWLLCSLVFDQSSPIDISQRFEYKVSKQCEKDLTLSQELLVLTRG